MEKETTSLELLAQRAADHYHRAIQEMVDRQLASMAYFDFK